MKISYSNKKTEKLCTNLIKAKKDLGPTTGIKLIKTINLIESASNFGDIMSYSPFHFHKLTGNLSETCSLDIEGRKSKWRLYVKPLNQNGECVTNTLDDVKTTIIDILIVEVKDHG